MCSSNPTKIQKNVKNSKKQPWVISNKLQATCNFLTSSETLRGQLNTCAEKYKNVSVKHRSVSASPNKKFCYGYHQLLSILNLPKIVVICYDDRFIMFQFVNSDNPVNDKERKNNLILPESFAFAQ